MGNCLSAFVYSLILNVLKLKARYYIITHRQNRSRSEINIYSNTLDLLTRRVHGLIYFHFLVLDLKRDITIEMLALFGTHPRLQEELPYVVLGGFQASCQAPASAIYVRELGFQSLAVLFPKPRYKQGCEHVLVYVGLATMTTADYRQLPRAFHRDLEPT